MTANTRPAAPAGSIYDLGYRHYEGKRRGRWYAAWSLYVEGVRGVWGFGRPMTAKAAPFILAGLYSLLALIQLAFSSSISQAISTGDASATNLATYHNYFGQVSFFIVLFLVAQAPELVCRDQRYHVLPLYFTRALGRIDYALARFASLATALFIALMVPMILLFIGDILMKPDTLQAVGSEWPQALVSIPASLLAALSLAAISLALASFSPRRAYAAIGLVAYFLLMEIVPSVIFRVGDKAGWAWADKVVLLRPTNVIAAASDWFSGVALATSGGREGGGGAPSTLGADAYVLAVVVSIVVFTGILLFKYRRIPA
jgi:ABC-2 type transport system permease protein